jgi:hypothetical protein
MAKEYFRNRCTSEGFKLSPPVGRRRLLLGRAQLWLTGFIEYDYYGHRNDNNTLGFTCGLACPLATTTTFPVNVTTNINVVKAGLNLKFGPNTRWGW